MKPSRLGLATFAVLFGAGIAMLLTFSRGLSVDRAILTRVLVEPYAAALRGGDWSQAWGAFTTASYRARNPLDAYRSVYAARVAAHGAVTAIDCDRMSGVRRTGGSQFIAASCRVRFTDGTANPARFSIVREGDRFAIDGTSDGIW